MFLEYYKQLNQQRQAARATQAVSSAELDANALSTRTSLTVVDSSIDTTATHQETTTITTAATIAKTENEADDTFDKSFLASDSDDENEPAQSNVTLTASSVVSVEVTKTETTIPQPGTWSI